MTDKPERPVELKRPRGRPRVAPRYQAATWLSAEEYDRLTRLAQASDTSVSATLRQLVVLRLKE